MSAHFLEYAALAVIVAGLVTVAVEVAIHDGIAAVLAGPRGLASA